MPTQIDKFGCWYCEDTNDDQSEANRHMDVHLATGAFTEIPAPPPRVPMWECDGCLTTHDDQWSAEACEALHVIAAVTS